MNYVIILFGLVRSTCVIVFLSHIPEKKQFYFPKFNLLLLTEDRDLHKTTESPNFNHAVSKFENCYSFLEIYPRR